MTRKSGSRRTAKAKKKAVEITPERKAFGDRVRAARLSLAQRRNREISRAEVGRWLDVTGQAVGRWEKGEKMPDLEMVARLADVLECDVAELAFGIHTIYRDPAEVVARDAAAMPSVRLE